VAAQRALCSPQCPRRAPGGNREVECRALPAVCSRHAAPAYNPARQRAKTRVDMIRLDTTRERAAWPVARQAEPQKWRRSCVVSTTHDVHPVEPCAKPNDAKQIQHYVGACLCRVLCVPLFYAPPFDEPCVRTRHARFRAFFFRAHTPSPSWQRQQNSQSATEIVE